MGCQQTKIRELSDEDVDFLKTHTKYDEQTIREWYEGFKVDCPSGRLSRKKFIDIYRTFFPTGNPEKFCDHVFRTFDTDNSGHIDFKEFLMAIGITASSSGEERLKWAFRMYDINNDGGIELTEMTKIVKALYDMLGPGTSDESPEERTKEIFLKMDKDGDGTLSVKEFVDGCLLDKKLAALLTANNGAT
ncbi:neuronal calcium sensor 2-like [Varroa jacobsoni]|uniref:EF-hand domain-containing protein n=1 Tax=Varroa destructor TaxID=109461 RepID=A0A7M7JX57_VARDE|nr:neuronal calcium sensor 2 isoform X2 [Varroa destructor]XP_022658424.1 neuronal calcium sensor 2 isoform X2 [Varroa destructor]XP_022658426.1 neuronal calcium sensor 2 isoform X2 [Varroa destructor]XP_022658427.1 neuronal calcium sensor 2 isoform X2 [Varroa destructor]XP_022658428.1 neuronal calcium sensor 2 isoform X2 [Varroa destructor]XP_022658429.1 neuronal calcium sensor 2 isoform X2 [Varroa destructor]XP_022658430.1 neuronal calcium sensor 2 isoform X2 [Varroa destructor]XP_02265843